MTLTAPHATREAARRASSPAGLVAGFAVYLALVVWIVLWKLEVPWVGGVDRVIKLVPFVASSGQGASKPSEVVINLLLFVPFGLYLGLLAPSWRWWRVAGVVAATSLALEITQFVLAIGSTDMTDVVVNTAGGVAGFVLATATRRLSRARGRGILIRLCVIGTVAALLAVTLFVVSPIRFRPPHDSGLGPAPGHAAGSVDIRAVGAPSLNDREPAFRSLSERGTSETKRPEPGAHPGSIGRRRYPSRLR